jgi:hypothetical protein
MSPGVDEDDARHALKCCIFGSLLGYIRRRVKHDKEQVADLQSQRAQLQVQLKQTDSGVQAEGLEARIDAIERELASLNQPLATLEDYLGFVAEVVSGPENFIRSSADQLRLTRMGVKLTDGSSESGYMVPVVEIHVACHEPRVATLVRFPRAELLPRPDYLAQADLFLAV